jgi:hypothetical protein
MDAEWPSSLMIYAYGAYREAHSREGGDMPVRPEGVHVKRDSLGIDSGPQ